jgi:shikimate dehydrogenase
MMPQRWHRFGLIGYPLGHSFSRKYFKEKFRALGLQFHSYQLFPLNNLHDFPFVLYHNPELRGLNVTIPYKTAIIPYLDQLDETANEAGAVNTIRIDFRQENMTPDDDNPDPDAWRKNLVLTGFNTDVYGFEETVGSELKRHSKALVLGTGGSSRAIVHILRKHSIAVTFVSRTRKEGCLTYEDIDTSVMENHSLIVNCTPAGMFPNIHQMPPLPYHAMSSRHLVYDLIYNPAETAMMREASLYGASCMNGLRMLHLQADRAWEIWSRNS